MACLLINLNPRDFFMCGECELIMCVLITGVKTNSGGGGSIQNAVSSISQAEIRRVMNKVFVIVQYKQTKCISSKLIL